MFPAPAPHLLLGPPPSPPSPDSLPPGAGFAFGNVPAVHENFSLVVLGIVLVSLLPIAWEMYAAKKEEAAAAAAAAAAKKEQVWWCSWVEGSRRDAMQVGGVDVPAAWLRVSGGVCDVLKCGWEVGLLGWKHQP